MRTTEQRFWAKIDVDETSGCWLWAASRDRQGYGRFQGKIAHRVSWTMYRGPVLDGLCVCHKCDNPPCVNPAHLFLGTVADNNADCRNKGRNKLNPARGEATGGVRLTEGDVRDIRATAGRGVTQREMAAIFNVGQSTIADIVVRKTWSHVA